MIVGYMRRPKRPGHMAKLLAMLSKYEGIDLIYLTPGDISINSSKVKGKMFINNKWLKVEADLPEFIDINPNFLISSKYKEIIQFLKKNTILSSEERMPLPKDRLQDAFRDDPDISQYLIPTKSIRKLEDIESFISEYEVVVLKPVRSNRGRNIYILKKTYSNYVLGINKEEKELTTSMFKEFFDNQIDGQDFIVQKCILSRDRHGNPFDCRIHVEKNDEGKWVNPKNYIRIGIGQKVISNVSQGGGTSNLRRFLKENFEKNWEQIQKEVIKIAGILPNKVEDVLGKECMTLGFDFGIDKNGALYLFEVNDFPAGSPIKSEMAMARVGYYRYVLEKNKY